MLIAVEVTMVVLPVATAGWGICKWCYLCVLKFDVTDSCISMLF